MTATDERLFWADPALLDFDALVTSAERRDALWAVTLDRTAFFPTAGGQPSDRGTLGEGRIVDVLEEGEELVHLVEDLREAPSGIVKCAVDAGRREDLACQHTAQHVVSALAASLFSARTVGFHLGERATTVDFEGGALDSARIREIERAANRVVRENRPVVVSFESGRSRRVGAELRREEGELRIVSIDGLGGSACCGAHVASTARLGAILFGRIEKVRGAIRVELFADDRALDEAERLHGLLAALSGKSGAGIDDLPSWADAVLAEARALKKENADLASQCAALEAEALLSHAEPEGAARLVARTVSERDVKALKLLAFALRKAPGTVALVAAAFEGKAALVVARAEGVALDVRPILKAAADSLGAKGGGTADLAQCGGGDPANLARAVEAAATAVRAALAAGEENP